MRTSSGGGQTSFEPPRIVMPGDIALPDGYTIEPVATGLTFPTGIAFDDSGGVYVTEAGYSYGEVFTIPRLLKVEPQGVTEVATGGNTGPWTGVDSQGGNFFVASGSQLEGGRILQISPDGQVATLVEGLPSLGDHHTNGPIAGGDGWIYFAQGTATNSGIVGRENADFGWLKRFPDFHDIPCRDITVSGENFETSDPLAPDRDRKVVTGAFVPFGTAVREGQIIPGRVPCSGSIMRVRPDGGAPELVAWGLRNPFGLAFSPDGRLYATDNSYDDRGSRPVFGTGDLLWEIRPGVWYGWPDFHGDHPLADPRFKPPGKDVPRALLLAHPNQPPRPAAVLPVHSSSNGFDFSRDNAFGYVGEAFIAQFGDQATAVGKTLAPVGFKIVRVDVQRGVSHDFAVNRGPGNGPASLVGGGGLERPLAVRFDPSGRYLYVVDFGVMLQRGKQTVPLEKTGMVWRIYRTGK